MNFKSRSLFALSVLASAATLVACSNQAGSGDAGGAAAASPPAALVSSGGKTVVSVSVLKKDPFLQEAERLFEEANPTIEIEIRSYTATPDNGGKGRMVRLVGGNEKNEADLEKYRSTVNTELMSGKGTDLYAVEDLAYARYAGKKLLADLGPLMEQDSNFRKTDYFDKVFKGVQVNGKSYALPVYFGMSAIMGNDSLLKQAGIAIDDSAWSWGDLLAKGQQASSSASLPVPIMTGQGKADLVADIVRSAYGQYVDVPAKKAAFDSKAFIALLEQLQDLYGRGLLMEEPDKSGQGNDVFKNIRINMAMDLVMMPQFIYGGKGKVYGAPSDGKGGGIPFTADLMLAVNEKSKVKAEAWKFLAFLLSEKMQAHPSLLGTAVHRDSLVKQITSSVDAMASGRIKVAGPSGEAPVQTVGEEGMKQLLAVVDRADTYAAGDPNVMKIVREEAQAYFNKEKSAQAAAGMMQSRVTTYLNE